MVALAQSAQLGMPGVCNPQQSAMFQAPKETKQVKIDEANPDHSIIIGSGLDSK